ncbi:hypothetical protein B7486_61065, partial [cyanobacterium TDX16]
MSTTAASSVIVGSGVAGSLVARWLADIGETGVLVLEAGPNIAMADPASWFNLIANGASTSNAPYAACYDRPADFSATPPEHAWNIAGGRIIGRG